MLKKLVIFCLHFSYAEVLSIWRNLLICIQKLVLMVFLILNSCIAWFWLDFSHFGFLPQMASYSWDNSRLWLGTIFLLEALKPDLWYLYQPFFRLKTKIPWKFVMFSAFNEISNLSQSWHLFINFGEKIWIEQFFSSKYHK